MEGYRFQQLAYLILPIVLGAEFFLNAHAERKKAGRESPGALALDVMGFLFAAGIPAIILITIVTLEFGILPLQQSTLHRMDRYGVMFMFLGSWWQVFLLGGLRARRAGSGEGRTLTSVLMPYLLFGVYISALILWVAPWNLMWVSIFWFVATFAVMAGFRMSAPRMARVFLALALFGFFGENILFLWLDAVV